MDTILIKKHTAVGHVKLFGRQSRMHSLSMQGKDKLSEQMLHVQLSMNVSRIDREELRQGNGKNGGHKRR